VLWLKNGVKIVGVDWDLGASIDDLFLLFVDILEVLREIPSFKSLMIWVKAY
jgi:hypothetical protein